MSNSKLKSKTQISNDDLISRADAIEALEKAKERYFDRAVVIARMQDILRAMPSAQPKTIDAYTRGWTDGADAVKAMPQPKRGEWMAVDSYSAFGGSEEQWYAHGNPTAYHYCSRCKHQAYADEFGKEILSDFCPNCGARMNSSEKPNNCDQTERSE